MVSAAKTGVFSASPRPRTLRACGPEAAAGAPSWPARLNRQSKRRVFVYTARVPTEAERP